MPTEQEKLKFFDIIQEIVTTKEIDYFEAILWYCDRVDLEVEVAATLISPRLKDLIEGNVADLNLLVKTAKLPI
jgi:hypothetical protein